MPQTKEDRLITEAYNSIYEFWHGRASNGCNGIWKETGLSDLD
jgi:hypothetical protein